MSKKIRLGIELDEVLRAKWVQFDRFYVLEFGEEGITPPFDTYDLMNHYHFADGETSETFLRDDFPDDIAPTEYQIDPETGKSPIDAFAFREEKTFKTAKERFEEFMYGDHCFELHGSAPKVYGNADVDLIKFMRAYRDKFEFVIVSKERAVSIPATLFFLSKMRVAVSEIVFGNTEEEIWDKIDWLVTTNPYFLETKPEGKITIKIDRLWNEGIEADFAAYGLQYLFVNEDIKPEELDPMNVAETEAFKAFLEQNITE